MGSYCHYCNQRCFVPFPVGTPRYIIGAYQTRGKAVSIIATCVDGQKWERDVVGYCYDDIQRMLKGT